MPRWVDEDGKAVRLERQPSSLAQRCQQRQIAPRCFQRVIERLAFGYRPPPAFSSSTNASA
jgi:hypothetical protein